MIIDAQEYLYEWEKANNPFYPNEMKWDRLTVNKFLCDYKQQSPIASDAVLGDRAEVIELFRWLLGYDDFPNKMDGEGMYYWRKELREKLKDIGINIK